MYFFPFIKIMLTSVILICICFRMFPIIFRKWANGFKIFLWCYGVQACFVYQKWKTTFYWFPVVINWNQFFIPACSRTIADYSNLNHSLLVLAFLARNWSFSFILDSHSSRLNFVHFFPSHASYQKFTWSYWQFERLGTRMHTSNPCRLIYFCIESFLTPKELICFDHQIFRAITQLKNRRSKQLLLQFILKFQE